MSFLKKLTSQKAAITDPSDRKFCQITCLSGGGVALVAMVLLIIRLAGYDPTYIWSSIALGIGLAAFFALAYLRYMWQDNRLVARFSDASVWLVPFGVYTPIELILVRKDLYENGSIVCAWVTFGLIALFSFFFLLASLASTHKFRLFGSFVFFLMAFSPLFGIYALLNAFYFSHFLLYLLLILTMLCFAATPIIFWFFDKYAWQRKVFYILMAAGTLCGALIPVLYAFCGR